MSHNNQSGNFFIPLAEFPWLSLFRMLCFIVRIEITGNLIFQALNLFFSGLCTIFFGGVTSVKKKLVLNFGALYLANQIS